jgi:hypothetical protein
MPEIGGKTAPFCIENRERSLKLHLEISKIKNNFGSFKIVCIFAN